MAAVINTNLASINAQRNLSTSQSSMQLALQRLSSGLRVNSAKDDAAGIAIASRMDAQVRGMTVAIRNANDGVSLAQTAEGAMSTVGDMLQRMRELAVQAANGTNSTGDLSNLNTEYQALNTEITRLAGSVTFNGIKVVGTGATAFSFQVGANSGETVSVTTTAITAPAGALTSQTAAAAALTALDTAINTNNTNRASMGAVLSNLNYTISNLQTSVENQTAAKSRIMDTDFAAETANLTRAQILQQAGTAMLAQANQMPNTVLSLLK